MRAVNLLPEGQRRARASGSRGGSAYFVIGALAVVLVAVVVYVLTANQVSTDKQQAQNVKREAVAAEARASQLVAFGDFAQVKATREASVTALASTRFDWERTLRELARVLPKGVYVTTLDGSTSGGSAAAGAAGGAAAGTGGPQIVLTGCAPSHREVATTLVRLKSLHGATEVKLGDSVTSSADEASGGSAAGASGTACADGDAAFNATIVFNPVASLPPANGKVPTSLGGGS